MESKRMCLKSYIRKLYYEKKISNDEMKCLLEKLEGHDKHLIRNERKSVIDCFTNRLSEYLGVENAAKYGNKYAEQQRNSYSTMMMYEVADLVDDLIEIVKQEAEKFGMATNVSTNGWIPCRERLPEEYVPVNVTWINRNPESYYAKIKDVPFSATAVYYNSKWYWYSSTCVDYLSEYGKNDFDLVDKDIDIIAWMELPSAYRPKEK